MSLIKLIPKIFYSDINTGLNLFVECLQFKLIYTEPGAHIFCIVTRDGVTVYLLEDDEYAKKDRPEIRIETDDIEAIYNEIKERCPQRLHPNLKVIKLQPWGLKEFALLDESGVCIIIHQSR